MKRRIQHLAIVLFCSFGGALAGAEEFKRCDHPAAVLEVVEGKAEFRYEGSDWQNAVEGTAFCYGDAIRITQSRAALRLENDTLVRLKEHSVVKLVEPEASFWVELLQGVAHFVSRTPKSFEVKAPYLNAAVDGTEFIVQATEQASKVFVVEGKVTAKNAYGQLPLVANQAAVAYQNSAPTLDPGANLTDTVSWAFHYPVLSSLFTGVDQQLQQLIQREQYVAALEWLAQNANSLPKSQSLNLNTALNLAQGNINAALKINQQALQLAPKAAEANALVTLIVLVQGDREQAVSRSLAAVDQHPQNPTVLLTHSFVLQAQFKLQQALLAAQKATALLPHDVDLWLRVAELALNLEDLPTATAALDQAQNIQRDNDRLMTLRSVIYLKQLKFKVARTQLQKAVAMNSTEPLSQFLLGLTYIRLGQEDLGRQKMELAVLLDPNNSLYRSYLGKTYYDEFRFDQASEQFELAKKLDPDDPTPYFYNAVQLQALGRPTQALTEIEYSLARNDNRAVYRSRLQLDADFGARSANLADVYLNLGFTEQSVQVAEQAKRSSNSEYGPFKIMADIYASEPHSGKAAASEYLQAQMRQPLSSLPMRPLLAETGLQVLPGAGPSNLGLSEYNALMAKNQNNVLLSAAGGSEDSMSLDAMVSGLSGRQSYLVESYVNESQDLFGDGAIDYKIHSLYYQIKPGENSNIFVNLISNHVNKEIKSVTVGVDRTDADEAIKGEDTDSIRLGFSHSPAENLSFYSTVRYSDRGVLNSKSNTYGVGTDYEETWLILDSNDSTFIDTDLLANFRKGIFRGDIGIQHSDRHKDTFKLDRTIYIGEEPDDTVSYGKGDLTYTKYYMYVTGDIHPSASLLVGLADITLNDKVTHKRKFGRTAKKVGLQLSPAEWLNINMAYFEDLISSVEVNQSLEPTQIFGIKQVVDLATASESDSLVVKATSNVRNWKFDAIAHKQHVYTPTIGSASIISFDKKNVVLRLGRLFEMFSIGLSVDSTILEVAEFNSPPDELDTHALPLEVSFFSGHGVSFNAKAVRVFQSKRNESPAQGGTTEVKSAFSIVDLFVNYQFRGYGGKSTMVSLGVRNALGEEFEYEPVDLLNSSGPDSETFFQEQYAAERRIVGSLTWLF